MEFEITKRTPAPPNLGRSTTLEPLRKALLQTLSKNPDSEEQAVRVPLKDRKPMRIYSTLRNAASKLGYLLHAHHSMKPYTEADITIVAGSAERLGFPIEPQACAELARFSRCSPARSNQLLQSARSRAVATDRPKITVKDRQ